MRLALLALIATASVASAKGIPGHKHVVFGKELNHEEYVSWNEYQKRTDRVPSIATDKERVDAFLKTLKFVEEHNAAYERGETSYQVSVNNRADWPEWEWKQLRGTRVSEDDIVPAGQTPPGTDADLPASIDWRQKGAVTKVKDQGHCGSCWTFGATGGTEGAHFVRTGKLVELSEQNLFDCVTENNLKCNGGSADSAFGYIEQHGIDTERSYPYKESSGTNNDTSCKFQANNVGATLIGHIVLPSGDEDRLKAAVATLGPVTVAINAGGNGFQEFTGDGVYYDKNCGGTVDDLDHSVLLVGYGTDEKHGDYWIVKNSWSESWGDKGFVKMARNRSNNCGIATHAILPIA